MNIASKRFILVSAGLVLVAIFASIPGNMELGKIYFKGFKYEESYRYISRVKQMDEDNLDALKYLKEYFVKLGDLDKASVIQEKIISLRPKNRQHMKELVLLHRWNNRDYEALKAREAEILLGDGTELSQNMAEIAAEYVQLKKYDDAARIYSIYEGTKDREILKGGIVFYLATKNLEKSIAWLERFLGLKENSHYRQILAECLEFQGKWDEAIVSWVKSINAKFDDPLDLQALEQKNFERNYSVIKKIANLLQKGRGVSGRLEFYRVMFRTFPEHKELAFDLADTFKAAGDKHRMAEVYRIYQRHLKFGPESYRDLAVRFADLALYSDAIQLYVRIINSGSASAMHFKELADFYNANRENELALKYYYKFLEAKKRGRGPSSTVKLDSEAEARVQVARLHLEKKEYTAAVEVLADIKPEMADNEVVLELKFNAYQSLNDAANTKLYRNRLLENNPLHQYAYFNLLNEMYRKGEQDQLLSAFKKLRETSPELYWHAEYTLLRLKNDSALGNNLQLAANCAEIKTSPLADDIQLECLSLPGKEKEKMLLYSRLVNENANDKDRLNAAIYFALDQGFTDPAGALIAVKKSREISDDSLSGQESYYRSLTVERLRQEGLMLQDEASFTSYEDYNLIRNGLLLEKKLGRLRYSMDLEAFSASAGPKKDAGSVTPGLLWKKSNFTAQAGYKIAAGPKDLSGGFSTALNWTRHQKYYAGIEYHHADYELGSIDAVVDRDSHKQSFTFYGEHYLRPGQRTEIMAERKKMLIKGDEFQGLVAGARFLWPFWKENRPALGVFSDYQEFSSGKTEYYDKTIFGPTASLDYKWRSHDLRMELSMGGNLRSTYSLDERIKSFVRWGLDFSELSRFELLMDMLFDQRDSLKVGVNYTVYI